MKMAESSPNLLENNVGKGEIALYEQFLLFPHCFQKKNTADTQKPGIVWERANLSYAKAFHSDESEFCRLGKG